VLEYCNGGDLAQKLDEEGVLPEHTAVTYLKQILDGFKGLHVIRAMHRDFKVENVMLHNGVCKLVDLGFGKQLKDSDVTQTKLGSNLTMAPEVMQRKPYGFNADIWSIGVVFYQLLEGDFPFVGRNIEAVLKQIMEDRIAIKRTDISEDAKDFIKRCLVIDPKDRIDWNEIYKHPLIASSNSFVMMEPENEVDVKQNYSFY
jgi:serine/threonine-protein kinase ULK2